MAVFAKTEIDVLREAIRKATLIEIENPMDPYDGQSIAPSVADSTVSRRDQLKLAIRIWTALGKFCRSQCNKGRVIDTLAFGSFAKGATVGASGPESDNYYVYCTGPNSAFTNVENRENISDIDQKILEEKLVQINFNSIASVCRCTPESVKSLLSAIKSEVVDFVLVRGFSLNLNFMVGSLTFTSAGSVEFKSASAMDTTSTFSAMLPSDMRSKAGDTGTERSLRAMQTDQQLGVRSPLPNSSNRKVGHSAFVNRKFQRDQSSSADNGGEEYGHLSQFLKEQITSRKQRSIGGGSRGSKRSNASTNNAIIDQVSKMRYDLRAVNDLVEQSKAGSNCAKVPMNTVRAQQTVQSSEGPQTVKDWKTMNMTHIHKPQYASPGNDHLRLRSTDNGHRTPVVNSEKLMPGLKQVDLDFNNEGITNDRALYRHSDNKLNNIISKSVNRKNISYAYHTGYPTMMNAQGPYAVYSHMKRMGEHAYQGERKTRKAAYNRFEDDLRNLQSEREGQRDQFFGNIKEEQMLQQAQQKFRLATNKMNQDYIMKQIEEDKEERRKARVEELAYKKPHFGPEETHDVIEDLVYEDRLKKHTVLNNLKAQIQHREEQRLANIAAERQCDRENLDRFIAVQNAENQAQREKIMNDKRKLKKAWEKQAAMRNDQEYRDNQFK